MLHKTTHFSPFPPTGLCNVNQFDASDNHFCSLSFAGFFFFFFFGLQGLKNTGARSAHQHCFCSSSQVSAAVAMPEVFNSEQALGEC